VLTTENTRNKVTNISRRYLGINEITSAPRKKKMINARRNKTYGIHREDIVLNNLFTLGYCGAKRMPTQKGNANIDKPLAKDSRGNNNLLGFNCKKSRTPTATIPFFISQ
jgi:hypothetical protein